MTKEEWFNSLTTIQKAKFFNSINACEAGFVICDYCKKNLSTCKGIGSEDCIGAWQDWLLTAHDGDEFVENINQKLDFMDRQIWNNANNIGEMRMNFQQSHEEINRIKILMHELESKVNFLMNVASDFRQFQNGGVIHGTGYITECTTEG